MKDASLESVHHRCMEVNVREVGMKAVHMKAVVVDIKDKYAIVLDGRGGFAKIKNAGSLKVGCEIDVPPAKVYNMAKIRKIIPAAAAVITVLSMGVGVYAYNTPYSYVSVDINPSVEITTNIFDRIIKVEALNADGFKIISDANYKNRSLKSGLEAILDKAAEEGYLKDDSQNTVLLTVAAKDDKKVDEIKKSVETAVASELEQKKVKAEVVVDNVKVESHDAAIKQGVSPGKMNLLNKLKEARPEAKMEDYKDAPVKDIMKSIQESQKESTQGKSYNRNARENNKENNGSKAVNNKYTGKNPRNSKDQDSKQRIQQQNEEKSKNAKDNKNSGYSRPGSTFGNQNNKKQEYESKAKDSRAKESSDKNRSWGKGQKDDNDRDDDKDNRNRTRKQR